MPYVDLIPSVMPISLTSLANGATYRSEAFNVGDKMEIGIVIKADQALSVRVAYGASTDTAATAGTGTSAALPFVTASTSFASSAGSAEAGTYHSIAIPPSARKAQLVISNSSGSTANSITVDAALRRQAYPSSGTGGGISNVVDADDWPAGVSITELGYIGGLTSDAQTQLNAKAASSHTHAASDIASGTVALARGGTNADLSATGGTGQILRQSSAGASITVSALAISDLPLKHIFQMTRITSATSGLSGSYADNNLVFNEETTDEGSDFTVSSGVATCQTAARYLLILASAIDQSQGIIYWIVKNSTKICEAYIGTYQSCNMSIVTSLAVNDTIKVVVAGASGPVIQPGAKLLAIKIGKGS